MVNMTVESTLKKKLSGSLNLKDFEAQLEQYDKKELYKLLLKKCFNRNFLNISGFRKKKITGKEVPINVSAMFYTKLNNNDRFNSKNTFTECEISFIYKGKSKPVIFVCDAVHVINIVNVLCNVVSGSESLPDNIFLESLQGDNNIQLMNLNTDNPLMIVDSISFTTNDVVGISNFLARMVQDVKYGYINAYVSTYLERTRLYNE